MRISLLFIGLLLIVALASCSDSSDPAEPAPTGVSGTWDGILYASAGLGIPMEAGTISLTIERDGDEITGTGTFSGTGDTFDLDFGALAFTGSGSSDEFDVLISETLYFDNMALTSIVDITTHLTGWVAAETDTLSGSISSRTCRDDPLCITRPMLEGFYVATRR